MSDTIRLKRMMRERKALEEENDDYVVLFKDENLFKFDAYVVAPSDTLYSYKFLKFHFEIPTDYPLTPPKCTFIQHRGGRIHPNLYAEGRVCLSILGTWEGENWASAMTCQAVLITIRSLLDNAPYKHEPNQEDHPDYNLYVQYTTWRWLLLDYLRREEEPKFQAFLEIHIARQSNEILDEFDRQVKLNLPLGEFVTPYEKTSAIADYNSLRRDLEEAVADCCFAVEETANSIAEDITVERDKIQIVATPSSS